MTWVTFTRRTNRPKLGYLIHRLKAAGIPCRFGVPSWHAPTLEVPDERLAEAGKILDERIGRYCLDDIRDDHPRFRPYGDEEPSPKDWEGK